MVGAYFAGSPYVGALTAALAGVGALATLAVGWWLGGVNAQRPIPEYKQVTFRTGAMGNARFAPAAFISSQACSTPLTVPLITTCPGQL